MSVLNSEPLPAIPRGGQVRLARLDDAALLAPRLRGGEVGELANISAQEPLEGLIISLGQSSLALAIERDDGLVVGLVGVSHPRGAARDEVVVWMLGAAELDGMRAWFLRTSPIVLRRLVAGWRVAYNVVPESYEKTLRWMTWLGFNAVERLPAAGVRGVPCWLMVLEVEEWLKQQSP